MSLALCRVLLLHYSYFFHIIQPCSHLIQILSIRIVDGCNLKFPAKKRQQQSMQLGVYLELSRPNYKRAEAMEQEKGYGILLLINICVLLAILSTCRISAFKS